MNSPTPPRPDLDLRALRYFLEVVTLGSFTKAAESLHVAQPALSVTVKKLEERLGVALVIRESRRVVPTAEGRILMEHARRVLEQVESARLAVEDAIELKRGDVRFGLPPMFGLAHVPALISGFHARHPGLTVTALEASADETAELLERGEIDVAILEERRVKAEWTQVPLGEDELVLGVATDHPLARRSTVSSADLDDLAMAVFDGSFIQRAILEGVCKATGAKPRFVLVSNFVPLIAQAAVDGVGAATLLRALAQTVPGLAAVSFEPRQVLRFSLCWRSELYLSNANRAFVDFVKSARL